MNNETIEHVKAQIGEIDRQMVELQSTRFNAVMRLSALLAQAAKAAAAAPPAATVQPRWYDSGFGGSGFEDKESKGVSR